MNERCATVGIRLRGLGYLFRIGCFSTPRRDFGVATGDECN